MPTIEASHKDLCSLAGRKIDVEKLRSEDILYAKGEVDDAAGDALKLDMKDTNRPDLWSVEGVARSIRTHYTGEAPKYTTKKSGITVLVDKSVTGVRPSTVCAVVRGLKINETVLSQIIQLQEKVAGTFGRNRKEVAIGVYDLHKLKPPIKYTTAKPSETKFTPLDFEKDMYLFEILQKHPKGKEFGHLLKDAARYPIFVDSENNVLSLPPIINSAHTGKVTEKTRDVFVECSGFDLRFLNTALNVIVAALHDRGGSIETVTVVYPDGKIETPDMAEKKTSASIKYINRIFGADLGKKEIIELLKKSGYSVSVSGEKLLLRYPAYRQDIMHQRDVVEDVIISYGLNSIVPEMKRLPVTGHQDPIEKFSDVSTEIMLGTGMQEILSYTLTNKKDLFEKMNLTGNGVAEIQNPASANWSVFRTFLLPGLMDFFSKNRHVEYPQKLFEIGNCVALDEKQETRTRDIRSMAAAISNSAVSYDEISSVLEAYLSNIGVKFNLKNHAHPSFIEGRCAEIIVAGKSAGIVGEVHPQVLNNWKLEKPVAAFEIRLDSLMTGA